MTPPTRHAVVVGGGITGTLVARALLLDGWGVTLLEAEHVGAGSSSRTAAGIRQQFSTRGTILGMRHAVAAYRRFADETGGDTVPIVQSGYLFLYGSDADWAAARQRVDLQRSLGLHEVEALEGAALTERFPWVDGGACVGGSYCPTDGFLRPEVVYQDAARHVRALGGRVVQKAPVTGGSPGERLAWVDTPKGRFEADLFVDCTNVWTDRLAAALDALDLPVDPVKRYLWFIRRDGGMGPEDLLSLPMVISPAGVYGRPENADTLLMGWARDVPPEPDFDREDQDRIDPHYAHDGGLDAVPFEAWMALAEAVPAIGEFAGVTATTSGFYGVTPDHNPFLGFDPQRPNLLRLVGFSGHGAMFGPFTASVARALADAGHDLHTVDLDVGEVPLEEFRLDRSLDGQEEMVI